MKKKFKVTFIVFLVVVLGCFSQAFAATNQKTKLNRIVKEIRNIKLLDSTGTDEGVVGTSNLNGTANNSAKVGNVLKSPEIGWKRYDDTNSNIEYSGTAWKTGNSSDAYNNSYHQVISNVSSTSVTIKFKGTKFRLIGILDWNYPKNAYVSIDNGEEKTFIMNNSPVLAQFQTAVYNETGLEDTIHTVKITQKDNSRVGLVIDAIDIDSTGYLVDASSTLVTGISLNKTTDSLTVGQTDTLISTVTLDDATNKNVTWKSSDTNIATVDSTGKVTATGVGTATITATTSDGTNLSSSCTVTVTQQVTPIPTPTVQNRAKLTINMINGSAKQYDLSEDELNSFLSWYNGMTNPESASCYVFNLRASGTYLTNKDYIPFNKIDDFQVQEYTE